MSPLLIVLTVTLPLIGAALVATGVVWLLFWWVGRDRSTTDDFTPYRPCCDTPVNEMHDVTCEALTAADFADELGIARASGVDATPTGLHDRDADLTDAQREALIERLYAAMSAAPRELPVIPGRDNP
jgi:hypothetical protein